MADAGGRPGAVVRRYPHEFSGGQCQRIGIARAMIQSQADHLRRAGLRARRVDQARSSTRLRRLQKENDLALPSSRTLSAARHQPPRSVSIRWVMEVATATPSTRARCTPIRRP
jgi:hypothetical protein